MLKNSKQMKKSSSGLLEPDYQLQNLVLFNYKAFPFPNQDVGQINIYKTYVHMDFNGQQLQKIIDMNHPYLMQVKKISKNSTKNKVLKQQSTRYYSFVYENVQYGLQYLLQNPQCDQTLLNKAIQFNIQAIVTQVISFLQDIQIYYPIKIDDIGISKDGQIKIYIPATCVVQSVQKVLGNKKYEKIINEISLWWHSSINKIKKQSQRKRQPHSQMLPPKLSIDPLQNDSLNESNEIQKEFDSLFEDKPLFQSYNFLQVPNMKQSAITLKPDKIGRLQLIAKQLKNMKQKLNEKTKRKGIQQIQRSQQISKNSQKNKLASNVIDIKHSFNLIKSQQMLKPNNFQKIQRPKQNEYYKAKLNHLIDNLNLYDDRTSLNTYEIEFQHHDHNFGYQDQSQKIKKQAKRQLSEYKKQKNRHKKQVPYKKHKDSINQVQIVNKNVNISAGPIFFDKMIKKIRSDQNLFNPQINNKIQINYLTQSQQKNKIVLKNKMPQKLESQKNQAFIGQIFHKKNINESLQQSKEIKVDQKISDNQKNNINLVKSCQMNKQSMTIKNNKNLEDKIKMALEKTKNAIQLFKKVKNRQQVLKTSPH